MGHDISTLSTIAKWFESKRGLMTSIAKIGTAMGQMVMPPLIAFLIISFGWRTATFYLGIVASIGLVLAASLMSTPNTSSKKLVSEDANLEVFDRKVFNLLAFCQFCIFFAMFTTMTHIAAHGLNVGLSLKDSALLLSIIGFSSIFGRLSIGVLADRLVGKKNLYGLSISHDYRASHYTIHRKYTFYLYSPFSIWVLTWWALYNSSFYYRGKFWSKKSWCYLWKNNIFWGNRLGNGTDCSGGYI